MKIDFVIPNQNQGWAYPLIKWKKNFKNKGLQVNVVPSPNPSKKRDIVFLTSRYYRSKYNTNQEFFINLKSDLRKDISQLEKSNTKIIYYDLSAAVGSRELSVLEDVDLFLKRQTYKDKNIYAQNTHPYRPWLEIKENLYDGCKKEHLSKICLGWNLVYQDFTTWSLFNPNKFKLLFFKSPAFTKPSADRSITASYRGKMAGQIVPQRKSVVDTLKNLNKQNPKSFITGPVISKREYVNEVKNSKALISPFGYGEICYRDMEAFINGSILVKPDMAHVETFPDVFLKDETYISTKWDLSDLRDTLLDISDNYDKYQKIAQRGQEVFEDYYHNFDLFYDHFISIVNRLDK